MDKVMTVDGRELTLTHVDKLFWPEEGYTKLDLLNYYAAVAEHLLPHLHDRPVSLRRHPSGIGGKSFFQHDIDGLAPEWAKTAAVTVKAAGEERRIQYLVCQDTATLLFMINLGCIEVNPWLARVGQTDRPDFLVIDLDPLDVGFAEVVQVALAAKRVLDELGLPAYPKTSGSEGMHIYVPLGARHEYDAVGAAAEALAVRIHREAPDLTSIERRPEKRPTRVYVDWLQNSEGKTVAAPYSVRPKPGATVSTPLDWSEVKPGLRPDRFHLRSMPRRLAQVGDLFAPVLGEGVDLRPLLARRAA